MSNTPSKAEIEALAKRHGATSYRNRADTQHPAYGFTEDGLNGLIDEALAKWGSPQPVVREPLTTLTIAPVRRFLADRGIYLSDETTKELIVVAHGITQKGGQHGTD